MIRRTIISLALLCGACSSFTLGYVERQTGKTDDDRALAMLVCKDQAAQAMQQGAQQVGQFLLGFTVVGYPIALQRERDVQRDAFAACMSDKGYSVKRANG